MAAMALSSNRQKLFASTLVPELKQYFAHAIKYFYLANYNANKCCRSGMIYSGS